MSHRIANCGGDITFTSPTVPVSVSRKGGAAEEAAAWLIGDRNRGDFRLIRFRLQLNGKKWATFIYHFYAFKSEEPTQDSRSGENMNQCFLGSSHRRRWMDGFQANTVGRWKRIYSSSKCGTGRVTATELVSRCLFLALALQPSTTPGSECDWE